MLYDILVLAFHGLDRRFRYGFKDICLVCSCVYCIWDYSCIVCNRCDFEQSFLELFRLMLRTLLMVLMVPCKDGTCAGSIALDVPSLDSVIDFSTTLLPAYRCIWLRLCGQTEYCHHVSVCGVVGFHALLWQGRNGVDDTILLVFHCYGLGCILFALHLFVGAMDECTFHLSCAVLHFVPIKVLYPSLRKHGREPTSSSFFVLMFSCLTSMLVVRMLPSMPCLFPQRVFFLLLSWSISLLLGSHRQ